MKKILLATAAITALGAFANSALAASSSSAVATVTAIIVEPTISIKTESSMTFGYFGSNSTGEVRTGSTSDNTVFFPSYSAPPKAASFEVSGEDGFIFDINLSDLETMIGADKGGIDDDLKLIVNGGKTTDLTTNDGKFTFDVDGVLSLGDSGALSAGKLTSSFTATVVYK